MAFKRPSIPSLSAKTPSDIRRAITSLVDYLTGMGKQQELVDESIKRLAGDLKEVGVFPGQPAPTGLVVTGAFNTIILQWDQSKTSGFSHTEVWRSPEDNLSNAQPVGSTSAYVFGDTPPDSSLSKTYYYWVRYVNQAGQPGPYNDTAGTPGRTADDPAYVLEVLTDEITEGQLYKGLNERIDKIEVNETAISEEITTRQSEDEALAQSIQTVSAVADGNTSAIQTEQTARINGDDALASNISTLQVEVDGVSSSLQTKAEVSDLEAVYEVKTDINGRVTGFGMVADATSTEFGINADRFWVADPSDSANVKIPFVIDGGRVVMDTALIKDGAITNAKIWSMAADKIYVTSGTIATAIIGTGHISNAMIANAAITNAKIGTAAIKEANIADAAITNAKIGTAAVGTLQIAGDAIFVPVESSGTFSGTLTESWSEVAYTYLTLSNIIDPVKTVIMGVVSFSSSQTHTVTVEVGVFADAVPQATTSTSFGALGLQATCIGAVVLGNVTNKRLSVRARINTGAGGGSTKDVTFSGNVIGMAGKR